MDEGKTEQEKWPQARWEELDRATPQQEPLSPELAMLESKVRLVPYRAAQSIAAAPSAPHTDTGPAIPLWNGSEDSRTAGEESPILRSGCQFHLQISLPLLSLSGPECSGEWVT